MKIKKEIVKGIFDETSCCKKCDYFFNVPFFTQQSLLLRVNFPLRYPKVCPECGGELKNQTGQYIFETIEKIFLFIFKTKSTQCIGFERCEEK